MSTPFQNRLVGTVIVAAVAIIFLPDILDGEKKTYQAEFENIPPAPAYKGDTNKAQFPDEKLSQLKTEPVFEEQAIDELPQTTEQSKSNSSSNDKVIAKAANKPESFDDKPKTKVKAAAKTVESTTKSAAKTLLEKSVPNKAWVIQLGSFKHKKNVEELVNKLKKNGYTVFTRPIKTKSGVLTKVFVGPELLKSTLEKKLPSLKKLTNVEGKLARFTPTK